MHIVRGEYMASNLFVNGCILISIIFIAVSFLESEKIKNLSSIGKNIVSGICFSISSLFLMKYSINVTNSSFFDFRAISQSSSAFYGGPLSSIITGLISSLFRLFYVGVNRNSVLTFISMMVSSLVCAYISKKETNKKIKWALLIISSKFIHMVLLILVINNPEDILRVLLTLSVGFTLVATVVYYVFDYLSLANKQVESLKYQARIDFLTGVHNTRSFNHIYEDFLSKLFENESSFSILMIDIDFFKIVNDTYGHIAGDKILKDLGYILNLFCTQDCIVGRVGGEEFCILLKEYSKEEAVDFSERLRKYIEDSLFIIDSKTQINITISIGISNYNKSIFHTEDPREIADQKLYECKKSGRNKVCF